MRYTVTTFDVCVQGFERLRSESEFLLVATIGPRAGWRTLRNEWLADMQSCERPEGFDYDAARACVQAYASALRRSIDGKPNPFGLESGGGAYASAFLYVRDACHGLEAGPPNLDCMDAAELMEWAETFSAPDRSLAAFIFPDRPRGMIRAARQMSSYAASKARAMDARAAGRIGEAQSLEDGCAITFKAMPVFARW